MTIKDNNSNDRDKDSASRLETMILRFPSAEEIKAKKDHEIIKDLLELSNQIDNIALSCVSAGMDLNEVIVIIAHRLGKLLGRTEDKSVIIDLIIKTIRDQANL
jgi:hypothetical protein